MGQVTDTKNHVPQSHHQQVFNVVDDGRPRRTDSIEIKNLFVLIRNDVHVRTIYDVRSMLSLHGNLKIIHNPRTSNSFADMLAKRGANNEET
ncbi:hypothetical protein Dsin_023345 [Dipteronia sinensis]|uniref:Uncharacterized protein n=1 Tax=Dipteronia sinensis TaxID=43782 RepID=A0AAE0E0K9_9ROSI|nr:hypothetical protein Dsin_023345 [Dipteronia sinensis]